MKKLSAIGIVGIISILMLVGVSKETAISYTSGAPEARTGSPGDGAHCATSGCHASNPGVPTGNEVVSLTSNIPETGYLAGATYDFTATMTDPSITKFGFEISPQNVAGDVLGTLIAGPETGLVGLNGYVTHTFVNTTGSGSRSWDFQWTAPEAGTGEVTFYGAYNFSNANGQANGDVILLTDTTIIEGHAVGMNDLATMDLSVYPLPATNRLLVQGLTESSDYEFVDLSGRTVQNGRLESMSNPIIDLDRSNVRPGLHLLRLTDSNSEKVIKIMIK